jgi:hypothetical protein
MLAVEVCTGIIVKDLITVALVAASRLGHHARWSIIDGGRDGSQQVTCKEPTEYTRWDRAPCVDPPHQFSWASILFVCGARRGRLTDSPWFGGHSAVRNTRSWSHALHVATGSSSHGVGNACVAAILQMRGVRVAAARRTLVSNVPVSDGLYILYSTHHCLVATSWRYCTYRLMDCTVHVLQLPLYCLRAAIHILYSNGTLLWYN